MRFIKQTKNKRAVQ